MSNYILDCREKQSFPAFWILGGTFGLGGVIYTLKIMANPDDLSFKVDVYGAQGKKKYNAYKLVGYIDVGHNNVILLNADEHPVIVGNIFFERFPMRKNRIVNKDQAAKAINVLYDSQSLAKTAVSLPFTDSTEETKRLIAKDAYITPSVPFVFPKKQTDIDRAEKEKANREKRAVQELQVN